MQLREGRCYGWWFTYKTLSKSVRWVTDETWLNGESSLLSWTNGWKCLYRHGVTKGDWFVWRRWPKKKIQAMANRGDRDPWVRQLEKIKDKLKFLSYKKWRVIVSISEMSILPLLCFENITHGMVVTRRVGQLSHKKLDGYPFPFLKK